MKPFDSDLYERDDNAKYIVIDWLATKDINAIVNPDEYGIDLLGEGHLGNYGIEVEVKQNWSGAKFPFPTIHYSARKKKFIDAAENIRFVTLNKEWTHLCAVSGETLRQAKIVTKDTKYTKAEEFIEIPIEQTRIYDIYADL